MNRREFLKGLGSIAAAVVTPKVKEGPPENKLHLSDAEKRAAFYEAAFGDSAAVVEYWIGRALYWMERYSKWRDESIQLLAENIELAGTIDALNEENKALRAELGETYSWLAAYEDWRKEVLYGAHPVTTDAAYIKWDDLSMIEIEDLTWPASAK